MPSTALDRRRSDRYIIGNPVNSPTSPARIGLGSAI
jgi:hypothetical protein